jgi:hypothetical protein
VVVTDGWNVLLFDHHLKLVWESTIQGDHLNGYLRDATAIVVPHPVRIGDSGTVIVGGTLAAPPTTVQHHHPFTHPSRKQAAPPLPQAPDGPQAPQLQQEGQAQQGGGEEKAEIGEKGEAPHDQDAEAAASHEPEEHFSYYAFDGRTGALRWRHEAPDFYDNDPHAAEPESLLPEHSYKLHVLGQGQHVGEMDWREFRHHVLRHLPHYWGSPAHTHFQLSRFARQFHSGRPLDTAPSTAAGASPSAPGLPLAEGSGQGSRLPPAPRPSPNVVVAHLQHGLEVIHLYTGRPLCRLRLQPGTLYHDINADGLIDAIRVTALNHLTQCNAVAHTGIPPMELLFKVSICGSGPSGVLDRLWSASRSKRSRGGRPSKAPLEDAAVEAAPPLVLPIYPTEEMWGGAFDQANSEEHDLLFLVSTGHLSCFSHRGQLKWELPTPARWTPFTSSFSGHLRLFSSGGQGQGQPAGNELLVVGAGTVAVVSREGDLLAEAAVPAALLPQLVIGDFNGDNQDDFVVATSGAYYGYTVQRSSGWALLPALVALLLLLMAFVAYSHRRPEGGKPNEKSAHPKAHLHRPQF